MTSVLQPWVERLSFRMQAALLSAVRGCDNVPKEDASKALQRTMRPLILKSAENPTSFMDFVDLSEVERRMAEFLGNFDHYPIHFVLHLLHAAEIIGYCCPLPGGSFWGVFYFDLCNKMHVHEESVDDLMRRLK